MIPVFTICMVIFVIVIKFQLSKNSRAQQSADEQFLEREHKANFTRKQDISNLQYIHIPLNQLPLSLDTTAKRDLQELANKKILNLTGISNTELKMQYGVSNLEILTEYDNNFTKLVNTLRTYSEELITADKLSEAQDLLEFAVSIHADCKAIYLMLAKLYQDTGHQEKIAGLINTAQQLHSISKDSIVHALSNM